MKSDEGSLQEVGLTVSTRPPRLLYLIEDRQDLLRAIRLYTHTWGGEGNAVLPVPRTSTSRFERAIRRCDPDLVLTSSAGLPGHVEDVLARVPAPVLRVTDSQITEHAEGPNFLPTRFGELPHVGMALRELLRAPLQRSSLRLIEMAGEDIVPLALQFGLPSVRYAAYLRDHLAARTYAQPRSSADFLKASMLSSERATPLTLTAERLRHAQSQSLLSSGSVLESPRIDSERTLFLFLDDGKDVGVGCAYWNLQRMARAANRLLLPLDSFTDEAKAIIDLLATATRFDAAILFLSPGRDQADRVLTLARDGAAALGLQKPVQVIYEGFEFDMPEGGIYVGMPEHSTRLVRGEGVLRFNPPAVPGLGSRSLLGFEAKIETESGGTLALPQRPLSTVLVGNSKERIRRAEVNESGLGRAWLRGAMIRATNEGVAGLERPGKEIVVHLHDADFVVEQFVRSRGFSIRSNTHTRFALAVVRMLGGIDSAMAYVRRGALAILSALTHHRAAQSGMLFDQIVSFIAKQCPYLTCNREDVARLLANIASAGLVRRGVPLRCPECDLESWYALERLSEHLECPGCLARFQMPGSGGVRFSYVANELGSRFVATGGASVLVAAAAMKAVAPSGYTKFGGTVARTGDSAYLAEIDLIRVSGEVLLVAECKSYNKVGGTELAEIIGSFRKSLEVASALECDIAILAISTGDCTADVQTAVAELADDWRSKALGVHLLLNGKLHIGGDAEALEPARVGIRDMLVLGDPAAHELSVGSVPANYGVGALQPIDETVMGLWETGFLEQSSPG